VSKIKCREMYVYRVIADGAHVERLRLISVKAGGWKEFESESLRRFKTRAWYPHTTAEDALLWYIGEQARLMSGCVLETRRVHLRMNIERAINTLQGVLTRKDGPQIKRYKPDDEFVADKEFKQ